MGYRGVVSCKRGRMYVRENMSSFEARSRFEIDHGKDRTVSPPARVLWIMYSDGTGTCGAQVATPRHLFFLFSISCSPIFIYLFGVAYASYLLLGSPKPTKQVYMFNQTKHGALEVEEGGSYPIRSSARDTKSKWAFGTKEQQEHWSFGQIAS